MSDREAFLRAIWERPHDDLPRLIYADWLDEHGEPERAEFIRVQCEVAGGSPGEPRLEQLRARERDLRWRHGRAWGRGPFHRGFQVPFAQMSGEEFVAAGDDLFRDAPLWSVRLYAAGPALAAILASRHLDRLYGLSLPDSGLGDDGVQTLAACPRLAGLSELELPGNRIGAAGLAALAASPHLAGLTLLDLSENSYGDVSRPHFTAASINALVRSPHLRGLTTLRLRLVDLGREEWRVLLRRFGQGLMWDMTEADLDNPQVFGR
jgi:uncharacterized protein (TIGR02996 family)